MNRLALPSLWLRMQLALRRINPLIAGVVGLQVATFATLAWLAVVRIDFDQQLEAARRQAARPAPPPQPVQAPLAAANQNLAQFYAALGERRSVERQLKTLFALAAKNGLVLRQGEYRSSYDRNAMLYTYRVDLPVTGRYGAIWQFAFDALRALPHASLDDVSLRRDAIGQENVDARLRMTLYLAATPGVPR